jgi:hypothetical protein
MTATLLSFPSGAPLTGPTMDRQRPATPRFPNIVTMIGLALAAFTLCGGGAAWSQTGVENSNQGHIPCGAYTDHDAKKLIPRDHVTYCFGRPMKRDEAIKYAIAQAQTPLDNYKQFARACVGGHISPDEMDKDCDAMTNYAKTLPKLGYCLGGAKGLWDWRLGVADSHGDCKDYSK